MAHGKSLELAAIKKPEPQRLCICGKNWETHIRKDGKGRLKKFQGPGHGPAGSFGGGTYRKRQRP